LYYMLAADSPKLICRFRVLTLATTIYSIGVDERL
jgi:hypothetical protein